MEKQKTVVRVAGKDYTLISAESPAYMHRVAEYVDRSMQEMSIATRMPSNTVAVLTSINLADELMQSKDENSRLRREIEELRQKLTGMTQGF